jgi:hypothetical protein
MSLSPTFHYPYAISQDIPATRVLNRVVLQFADSRDNAWICFGTTLQPGSVTQRSYEVLD